MGERDLNLLDAAIHRPQATFGGEELYQDIHTKAAALCHSIIFNYGFIDGNKRTAITSSLVFLALNRYRSIATNQELENFTVQIVEEKYTVEDIALWLRKHTEKK